MANNKPNPNETGNLSGDGGSSISPNFETIVVLFVILGVIIFCIVYQPKKVQPILDLIGLKKIDANTPIDIDKAIALFSKEANKKIPKGSHVIIRKTDFKTHNNAIEKYIHWKMMQNFTERGDIDVYGNDNIIIQDIKSDGEIFTISASLEEFNGVSYDKLFGDEDYYDYRFFISMNKNEIKAATDVSVLMVNYAIIDKNLERSEFWKELQSETSLKRIEKSIEEIANDSLMEQECISELEESLLSFLNYEGEHSKQIKILFDDKNCILENCFECIENYCRESDKCKPCDDDDGDLCSVKCDFKAKCFSYNHYNSDACGYMSMKSNVFIKGCPAGSIWRYNFCEPAGEEPHYSVPENTDCKDITPKRVKDNTTYK